MPRRDWNILAPLAGLAGLFTAFGLGAYTTVLDNPEQGYPRYSDAREQRDQVNPATAINLAKPHQYRTPCNNPQGESESDLCAQWRAAQAAEESAFWTKLGFWAGLFGLAGLYWQVILTRRAVEDTSEATDAMREANSISQKMGEAQVRAYVRVSSIIVYRREGRIQIQPMATNSGQSPGLVSHLFYEVLYGDLHVETKNIDSVESIAAGVSEKLTPVFFYYARESERLIIKISAIVTDVFNVEVPVEFQFVGPAEWLQRPEESDDDIGETFRPATHIAAALDMMRDGGDPIVS